MKELFQLFLIFLKIGGFTFGGGLAMIPFVEREVVDKKGWITSEEMMDIVAIAESTPGVIALNTATFVGAKVKGFAGAIVASIGVMLPSVIIIALLSPIILAFRDNSIVVYALIGIRSAVVVLILNAVIKLYKSINKSVFSYLLIFSSVVLCTLSLFNVIKLDVVFILIASAIVGIVRGYMVRGRNNEHIS